MVIHGKWNKYIPNEVFEKYDVILLEKFNFAFPMPIIKSIAQKP
jgi:hypothetical protein